MYEKQKQLKSTSLQPQYSSEEDDSGSENEDGSDDKVAAPAKEE